MQSSIGIYTTSVYKILHETIIYRIYWQNVSHNKVRNQYNPIYNNRTYDTIEVIIQVLVVGPPDGKYHVIEDCDGQHQEARYQIVPNIFTTTLDTR